MTREEAINLLKDLTIPEECEMHEAVKMAIQALQMEYKGYKYTCSHCGKTVFYATNESYLRWCPGCGERMVKA